MPANFFTNVKTAKPYSNPKPEIVVSFAVTEPCNVLQYKKQRRVVVKVFASIKLTLPVIGKEAGEPKLKDARLFTLKIEGMACQFCAKTVRERSEALPEMIQAIVYLQNGKAEIIVGREVSLDELAESIERAGFKVQILSVVPYEHGQ